MIILNDLIQFITRNLNLFSYAKKIGYQDCHIVPLYPNYWPGRMPSPATAKGPSFVKFCEDGLTSDASERKKRLKPRLTLSEKKFETVSVRFSDLFRREKKFGDNPAGSKTGWRPILRWTDASLTSLTSLVTLTTPLTTLVDVVDNLFEKNKLWKSEKHALNCPLNPSATIGRIYSWSEEVGTSYKVSKKANNQET